MDRTESHDLRWDAIERRMRELEPVLRRRGTIVMKAGRRSPAWSLRYKDCSSGRRVQRSLYLGIDPSLILRAQQLLQHFRKIERWNRELDTAGRRMKQLVAFLKRPHRSDRNQAGAQGAVRH
jgi:hypothetical protein